MSWAQLWQLAAWAPTGSSKVQPAFGKTLWLHGLPRCLLSGASQQLRGLCGSGGGRAYGRAGVHLSATAGRRHWNWHAWGSRASIKACLILLE
jgi:hypothetical protein